MAVRGELIIDLGRRQLRVLVAERDRRLIRIQRTLVVAYPDWLDTNDTESIGRWVREQLDEAGIARGRATFVLSRERVVLKRLTLPTVEDDEVPEMTRLTMQRDLPFSAEGAAIDYVPVGRTESHSLVLAVAVPQNVLHHVQDVAKHAGLKIARITVRGMGSAALLQAIDARGEGAAMVIDVTSEAVEFVLVTDGVVRITRAAELTIDTEHDRLVQALITETRRTWMSYRIAEDATEVQEAVLLGNGALTDEVAREVQSVLGVQTRVLRSHPQIDPGEAPMTAVWPLAGALLEGVLELEEIDLAHPRQAPDRAANRRKRALMTVAAVIVALLGAWTFARMKLDRLDSEIATLREQYRRVSPDYIRAARDSYRLEHIDAWRQVHPSWLDHLSYVTSMSESRRTLVFDAFSGSLDFRGVEYDEDREPGERWFAPTSVSIVVEGEAADRSIADALREALVKADRYTATSSGADAPGGRRLPFSFTYRLTTDVGVLPRSDEQDDAELKGGES